jgi:hypothetical protein
MKFKTDKIASTNLGKKSHGSESYDKNLMSIFLLFLQDME